MGKGRGESPKRLIKGKGMIFFFSIRERAMKEVVEVKMNTSKLPIAPTNPILHSMQVQGETL